MGVNRIPGTHNCTNNPFGISLTFASNAQCRKDLFETIIDIKLHAAPPIRTTVQLDRSGCTKTRLTLDRMVVLQMLIHQVKSK